MSPVSLPSPAPVSAPTDLNSIAQGVHQLQDTPRFRAEPTWLRALRRGSLDQFARQGFPTAADEDWRFSNPSALARLPFRPAADPISPAKLPPVHGLAMALVPGDQLVFVDGHFMPSMSRVQPHPGAIWIGSLAQALRECPERVEPHLSRSLATGGDAFAALNGAGFTDGAFIHVPAGSGMTDPIHLLFLGSGLEPGGSNCLRNLVVVDPDSQVTVLESYHGAEAHIGLTHTVTELIAGDRAQVEHLRLQDEPAKAHHLGSLHLRLGRETACWAHSFALGACLARQQITAVLDGEGLNCVLNGLYVAGKDQLLDHHMIVDHARPRGASHEYFNGILADRARGVFHGRILVREGAQKTDAKQTNKNLLLSDEATIHTQPQLEIYADDVKCTHGATVGQLNPESVFYLRARGIPLETARRMLIHAFAGEIIERVRHLPTQRILDRLIWDRLEGDQQVRLGN